MTRKRPFPPQARGKRFSMHSSNRKLIEEHYPACRRLLQSGAWDRIVRAHPDDSRPETFPETLTLGRADIGLPEFLPELARLEWNFREVASGETKIQPEIDRIKVNPSVRLIQVPWKGLPEILKTAGNSHPTFPPKGEEFVLIWRHSKTASNRGGNRVERGPPGAQNRG